MDRKLPPLPSWDEDSLARNKYDPQFMKGSQDFWKGNTLEKIDLKEAQKCEHVFRYTNDGIECKKCRIGWVGKEIEVRDGKLFFKNELITL
jgi:hypothetical protein